MGRYGHIPFMIKIEYGCKAILNLVFINDVIPIEYTYICIASNGDKYAFRTKEDAELAVKYNGWTYFPSRKKAIEKLIRYSKSLDW